METPVLSKVQKKLSLTGKKAKKEIIKNVVVDPHKIYWPLVIDELDVLTNVLKENLPRIKPDKVNVPWRLIKNVPKEERKTIRKSYLMKHCAADEKIKEDNLVLGVNGVVKLLESDACSVVLVANMNPRIVVKHVIEMAVLRNVPVLVLSTLKEVLKEVCGIESMAVAVKKNIPESCNLSNIVKKVVDINKNYPVNADHINTTRSKILLVEEHKSNDFVKTIKKKETQEKITNCHLPKISDNEKAFVPISDDNQHQNITHSKIENTLQFQNPVSQKASCELTNQTVNKKKAKKLYKALVVKRVKGNKDREKDKSKKMKKIK